MTRDHVITFDDCEIDLERMEISISGAPVAVEPQVFDLIRFLAENGGRLVTRDELIEQVWGGRIVSDAAVSTRINLARKALGDSGKAQRVIQTVPRRGFRFLPEATLPAPVQTGAESTAAARPDGAEFPDKPSIVVLPFECLGDDPETESLALGLRIDIQNALIKVSGLFVIAAGSAARVGQLPIAEAAGILGVRYALRGQVRRAGDTVRFSVQLVDAAADRIVWSDNYDRKLEDTFRFLDEVTSEVITAMNVKLVSGEAARVWHKTLTDLKSLEVFYRGMDSFFRMSGDSLASARHDFENVALHHPDLSIGPTWVSVTCWYQYQRGWARSPEEARRDARHWAERAIAHEDSDGQAHTVLSHVYLLDGEFGKALDAGAEAVRNRPSCTHANAFYANVLHYCDRQDAALRHIRLAIRHSPFHPPLFKLILAAALAATGAKAEAAEVVETVLVANPDDIAALVLSAELSLELGRPEAAATAAHRIRALRPDFSVADYVQRQPYRDRRRLQRLHSRLVEAGLPA